jgi:hypothetical protein
LTLLARLLMLEKKKKMMSATPVPLAQSVSQRWSASEESEVIYWIEALGDPL